MAREKIVEGHSTKPVHQERSTYPPGGHCGDLGAYELRSIGGEVLTGGRSYMQSHSREATGIVTPFDNYAESQSRSDCCAEAKRLLPNFVKYEEAQSRSLI